MIDGGLVGVAVGAGVRVGKGVMVGRTWVGVGVPRSIVAVGEGVAVGSVAFWMTKVCPSRRSVVVRLRLLLVKIWSMGTP